MQRALSPDRAATGAQLDVHGRCQRLFVVSMCHDASYDLLHPSVLIAKPRSDASSHIFELFWQRVANRNAKKAKFLHSCDGSTSGSKRAFATEVVTLAPPPTRDSDSGAQARDATTVKRYYSK